ncbi:MAG: vWA domain-containing protein [Acidobacteriota bacterium]
MESTQPLTTGTLRPAAARALAFVGLAIGAIGAIGALGAPAAHADDVPAGGEPESTGALVFVLDGSGSMWGQVDGDPKIVIARRALGRLIDDLPEGGDVALLAYGHRREGDCADIETVAPLGALDRAGLKRAVDAIHPRGKTPITASVERALELVESSGEPATVILLSDGLETCGGDPCRAVRLAREAGLPMVLHVVGFAIDEDDQSQLQCMAAAGGGRYAPAEDAAALAAALDQAVALPVTVAAGRLAVLAVADGELHDVSVRVLDADGGAVATARTYRDGATNPTAIPLPDGDYTVRIEALGIKGGHVRRFPISIKDGGRVEKEVDFSTGELKIAITHNDGAADVSYRIYDAADGRKNVATGRERDGAGGERLTPGRYDVTVKAVGIGGRPTHTFAGVELEPGGDLTLEHHFESGVLRIGAVHGAKLVDATLSVRTVEQGEEVAKSRTYTGEATNPKTFVVPPGRYRVGAKGLSVDGKPRRQVEVTVTARETAEVTIDFAQ